jgi:hypothetical protein
VNLARTPARKGRDSTKDCVAVETYLEAVRKVRAQNSAVRIVFVSSNTKDYADGGGAGLKPDLAADFAAVNMEYQPKL